MRLRGYRQGDVEAMYRLDLECFAGTFQFDRESMLDVAEDPRAIVVVVEDEDGDEMLGFLIVHQAGKGVDAHAYIITIDVASRTRRTGVGKAMLREAEGQAVKSGLNRMALHVAIDNEGAITFYERQGYERTGVAKRFYRKAGLDALIYAKAL